jgi:hypothetical protein
VDRRAFDRLLLRNAEENGVAVLQPAQALRPQRLVGGGWRVCVDHAGRPKEIVARFLVDASGGGSLLSARRSRVSAPLLALCAEWTAAEGEIEGCVEAGEDEWFWQAPIGRGTSVVAVFLDPKRLSGTTRESIATAYHALLARFRLFRAGRGGRVLGGIAACDASSRYAEQPAGPDFLRVGDANLSVDPLSSQGIQLAVATGLQAAIVANTLIRHPANAEAAIGFYHDRQRERIRQYAAETAGFYRERAAMCERPFWRQRAAFAEPKKEPDFATEALDPACRLRLSRSAKVESMPVIQGDLIASAPALRHQSLDRPVAFLGGVELAPLLRQIRPGQTAGAIVEAWSERLSSELSWDVLSWLWRRRILVPLSDA